MNENEDITKGYEDITKGYRRGGERLNENERERERD